MASSQTYSNAEQASNNTTLTGNTPADDPTVIGPADYYQQLLMESQMQEAPAPEPGTMPEFPKTTGAQEDGFNIVVTDAPQIPPGEQPLGRRRFPAGPSPNWGIRRHLGNLQLHSCGIQETQPMVCKAYQDVRALVRDVTTRTAGYITLLTGSKLGAFKLVRRQRLNNYTETLFIYCEREDTLYISIPGHKVHILRNPWDSAKLHTFVCAREAAVRLVESTAKQPEASVSLATKCDIKMKQLKRDENWYVYDGNDDKIHMHNPCMHPSIQKAAEEAEYMDMGFIGHSFLNLLAGGTGMTTGAAITKVRHEIIEGTKKYRPDIRASANVWTKQADPPYPGHEVAALCCDALKVNAVVIHGKDDVGDRISRICSDMRRPWKVIYEDGALHYMARIYGKKPTPEAAAATIVFPDPQASTSAQTDSPLDVNMLENLKTAGEAVSQMMTDFGLDIDKSVRKATFAMISNLAISVAGLVGNLIGGGAGRAMLYYNIVLWSASIASSLATMAIALDIGSKAKAISENVVASALIKLAKTFQVTEAGSGRADPMVGTIIKSVLTIGLLILGAEAPKVMAKLTALTHAKTTVSSMYSTIAETLYWATGLDIDGSKEYVQMLDSYQEKINKYLTIPLSHIRVADLKGMVELQKECNKIILSAGKSDKVSLLTERMAALNQWYVKAKLATQTRDPGFAPPGFYFHSLPGRGKTTFVKERLIPALNKIFSVRGEEEKGYYVLTFTGDHPPAYGGQYWGLADEIGNSKPTNGGKSINGATWNEILSSGGAKIPGADLSTKDQKTDFKAVFFMSNRDPKAIEIGLVDQAKAAFIDRLHVFEVNDPNYKGLQGRDAQSHRTPNFEHLEFLETPRVDTSGTETAVKSTALPLTADEVIQRIAKTIYEAKKVYETRQKMHSQGMDDFEAMTDNGRPVALDDALRNFELENAGGHRCITISGRPGAGKTTWLEANIQSIARAVGKEVKEVDEMNPVTLHENTIHIFDDKFDLRTVDGQKEFSATYNQMPKSSMMVLITNYLSSAWSWRSFSSGCVRVDQIHPGTFRRLGWEADTQSRSYCFEKGNLVDYLNGTVASAETIVTLAYTTIINDRFHVGKLPAVITVTPQNADIYYHMDRMRTLSKMELMTLLATKCSGHLALFMRNKVDEVDPDKDHIANFTYFFKKYAKEMEKFSALIQVEDQICLLQDGHIYLTRSNYPWKIMVINGKYWHVPADSKLKRCAVDMDRFRRFRNQVPATTNEEAVEFCRFAGYMTQDLDSYSHLQKIPVTWKEMMIILDQRATKYAEGLKKFISENKLLLAILVGVAGVAATGLMMSDTKVEMGINAIRQRLDDACVEHEKHKPCSLAERTEALEYLLEEHLRPEDHRFICEATNVCLYEKGRAGGKISPGNYAKKAGRRNSIKIGGLWYYDDEINDVGYLDEMKAAAMAIGSDGAYADRRGNAHATYKWGGKTKHVMVTPNQSSVILEDYMIEAGSRGTMLDMVSKNLMKTSCLCMNSHAIMLTSTLGLAPRHTICRSHPMSLINLVGERVGTIKPLQDNPAHETCIFSVTNQQGRIQQVANVKDITGHLPTAQQLKFGAVDRAMAIFERGGNFDSIEGSYIFKESFTAEDVGSSIGSWRSNAGVFQVAVSRLPQNYLSRGSHPSQQGDCGIPYGYVDSTGKAWFLGFHTAYQQGALWGVCFTRGDWERSITSIRDNRIEAGETLDLKHEYTRTPKFHPEGRQDLMDTDLYSMLRRPANEHLLTPVGEALETVAEIHNNIPYDPPTKKAEILPRIDVELIGPTKVPALQEEELRQKCPEKGVKDANGNIHTAYTRLHKAEGNVAGRMSEHATLISRAAQELSRYDQLKYGIGKIVPLTPSTILNGRPGQEKLKLKKSAGAISQMMNRCSMKEQYFDVNGEGDDEKIDFKMNEAGQWLKVAVRDHFRAAVRGQRIIWPYTLGMKPEMLEKGKEHKKRVVQNSHLVVLMNMRRYCQPLAAAFNKHGVKSPYILASDPVLDWNELANELLQHGTDFTDFDFSSFDFTVPDNMIKGACEYIAQFYKHREDSKDIEAALAVFAENIAYDPMLYGSALISKQGGIASGIESTSFIDSIICRLSLYVLLSLREDPTGCTLMPSDEFARRVLTKGGGDDFLLNWAPKAYVPTSALVELYNDYLGMTATNGAKTGEAATDEPSSIRDVQFLSRTFVSIKESPFWHSKLKPVAVATSLRYSSTTDFNEQLNQLEAAAQETIPYGEEAYNAVMRGIVEFASAHGLDFVPTTYWSACKALTDAIKGQQSKRELGFRSDETEREYTVAPDIFASLRNTEPVSLQELRKIYDVNENKPEKMDCLSTPTPRAVIRAWKRRFTAENGLPVRAIETMDGGKAALSKKGAWIVVNIKNKPYTIPTYGDISCFKFLLDYELPQNNVEEVSKMTGDMSALKQVIVDRCRILESLRAEIRNDRSNIPAKQDLDAAVVSFPSVESGEQPTQQAAAAPKEAPGGGSTVGGEGVPAIASQNMKISEAMQNTEEVSLITGGPTRPGADVVTINGGIALDDDIAQIGLAESVLSFAYKQQFIRKVDVSTETAEGFIIDELNVDPWNQNMLSEDAFSWADQHERFTGSINYRVHITTTPGLYGRIAVCFIPPQYSDLAVSEVNLSRFQPSEIDVQKSGETDVKVKFINEQDTKLLYVARNSARNYGRVVLWLPTRLGNIYGSVVPIAIRLYSAPAEDAVWWKPSFNRRSGGSTIPGIYAPAGTSLVGDGTTGNFYGRDGIEAGDGVYPDMQSTWIFTSTSDRAPYRRMVYRAVYNNAHALVPGLESPTPTTRNTYAAFQEDYSTGALRDEQIGHGIIKADGMVNEQKIGIGGNTTMYFEGSGTSSSDTVLMTRYTKLLPNPDFATTPAIIIDNLNVAPYQASSNAGIENEDGTLWALSQPSRTSGDDNNYDGINDFNVDRGTESLYVMETTKRDASKLAKVPVFTTFSDHNIGYDVQKDWRPANGSRFFTCFTPQYRDDGSFIGSLNVGPGSGSPYVSRGIIHATPSGMPSTFVKLDLADPEDNVLAVLDGVEGNTVLPGLTACINQAIHANYFRNTPGSIVYDVRSGSDTVGQIVANQWGFWTKSTNVKYFIGQDDAANYIFSGNYNVNEWPSTIEIDHSFMTDRTVTANSAPSRFEGVWTNTPPKDLGAKKLAKIGGVPASIALDASVSDRQRKLRAKLQKHPEAGIVGGVAAGFGSGLIGHANRKHELEMQANTFKQQARMAGIAHKSKMAEMEAKIGQKAQLMETEANMTLKKANADQVRHVQNETVLGNQRARHESKRIDQKAQHDLVRMNAQHMNNSALERQKHAQSVAMHRVVQHSGPAGPTRGDYHVDGAHDVGSWA